MEETIIFLLMKAKCKLGEYFVVKERRYRFNKSDEIVTQNIHYKWVKKIRVSLKQKTDNMIWYSGNKDKLEVGKIYWTYYMETSNKGNLIRNHTGLFQVKVIKHEKLYGSIYSEFEIINGVKFSPTMNHNIRLYLNGYGTAQCTFSDDYDELVKFHDKEIKEWSKYLNTNDRSLMLSKLIIKEAPIQSKIEKETMTWLNTLSQKELKYVQWIKTYFEGIDKLIK